MVKVSYDVRARMAPLLIKGLGVVISDFNFNFLPQTAAQTPTLIISFPNSSSPVLESSLTAFWMGRPSVAIAEL